MLNKQHLLPALEASGSSSCEQICQTSNVRMRSSDCLVVAHLSAECCDSRGPYLGVRGNSKASCNEQHQRCVIRHYVLGFDDCEGERGLEVGRSERREQFY
jgi:hypothetical protein